MRRLAALFAALLLAPAVAAAPLRQQTVSGKVGKSNVQVRLLVHPQVDGCTTAQTKLIQAEALKQGLAHVRETLPRLIAKAKTDASAPGEFFGVSFLVGCPKDGTAWIAFPAEGKEKAVSRYSPELGWSPMARL